MEMHQVRYFLAVAEHLNFTRAAERLHVAQPSLTRAIQKLEEELGGLLFHRERSKTHLTELGRMMLPHLSAALSAAEAAKRQAQSFRKREVGQIALGCSRSLTPAFASRLILETAGEIEGLELSVAVDADAALERELIKGNLDALLSVVSPEGEVASERFDQHVFREEPLAVAPPPGHRFAVMTEVMLDALDGEPLVIRADCRHEAAVAAAMEARGLMRVVRCSTGDTAWIVDWVRAGLGCAVLPEATARTAGLPHARLVDLPVSFAVTLVTMAGRRHSPALAGLVRRAQALRPRAAA
jgi:DNA-binding transcriptional LysR family regulator